MPKERKKVLCIEEIKGALGCAEKKAVKLLDELEKKCGLIERKRQGLGKPNLIYVKNFISGSVERQFLNCQKDNSGVVKNTIQELSKAQGNNTDTKYIDLSDTDPFFPSGFCGKEVDETDEFTRYYKERYLQRSNRIPMAVLGWKSPIRKRHDLEAARFC